MSCSMTRRSDAGEARNCGPLVSSSQCLNTKCGQANSLELGLAGDQVGPGTGPDFLAKHKSGSIDFVESLSENMGIYMEFRKVWPFKCQNSENGTFIILSFF